MPCWTPPLPVTLPDTHPPLAGLGGMFPPAPPGRPRLWREILTNVSVRVEEKRRPAINLVRRVPNVLLNLARLTYAIRVRR